MSPLRRENFVAGRIAIGRALQTAGCASAGVAADSDGVPVVPRGFLGSIAHKHGRAVAIVAPATFAEGIGVDLEFDENHDEATLHAAVVTSSEVGQVTALAAYNAGLLSPATLVLAAKEASYKAVFPKLRSPFGFDELQLSFRRDRRSFQARSFPGDGQLRVSGRYRLVSRWIVTIAVARLAPLGV
jgi:4'-phosphopantetheinyl transferase EntD